VEIVGEDAAGAFEALAGDTGALGAAEEGGFRRAYVVAVEAGDGEGLEDVEFDEVHGIVELLVRSYWLFGVFVDAR
jgi:hypothetical protein